jgi:hypothetical protein
VEYSSSIEMATDAGQRHAWHRVDVMVEPDADSVGFLVPPPRHGSYDHGRCSQSLMHQTKTDYN